MKLLGIRDGPRTHIGRLFDDGTVATLTEAPEFSADLASWTALAAALPGEERARDMIAETPAVPPAARVLCVGLNHRLHAEEAGLPIPGSTGRSSRTAGTSDMIFSVGEILAYLSGVMTLNPDDVVTTGTPQGVGSKRSPPRFLGPADVVEVEIDRVGAVANPVVARVTG